MGEGRGAVGRWQVASGRSDKVAAVAKMPTISRDYRWLLPRGTMSCTHAAATPTPRAAFAFDAETQRQQQRERHMWQMQRRQPQQVVAAFSHAHVIIAIDASCTRCTRAAFSTLSSLRQIRCVVYDSAPGPRPTATIYLLLYTWLHAAAFCMPQIPCGKPIPPVVGPSNTLSRAKVDCSAIVVAAAIVARVFFN